MIHEIIDNIYIKTDSGGFIEELIIQTIEKHFYYVQTFGFRKIEPDETFKKFEFYKENNLKGLEIIDVGSDVASILIELSNRTFLRFQINGMEDATYYIDIIDKTEYKEIKELFDSCYQKLNLRKTYAEW